VAVLFVTICTYHRVPILSHIKNRESILTGQGKAVHATWVALPERFPTIEAGPFVVMPNHVHGILAIVARRGDKEGADREGAALPASG
jgi:REP element-mobilizing transposase RayT